MSERHVRIVATRPWSCQPDMHARPDAGTRSWPSQGLAGAKMWSWVECQVMDGWSATSDIGIGELSVRQAYWRYTRRQANSGSF